MHVLLWSVRDGSRLATGPAHLPAGLWLWALSVALYNIDRSTPHKRRNWAADRESARVSEQIESSITNLARRKVCKTVTMDAGPDAFQRATPVTEPPLGASPRRKAGRPDQPGARARRPGARAASRQLLPEPHKRLRCPRPPVAAPARAPAAEVAPEPEIRRRRRWLRMVALAAVIFAAGAASGTFLGNKETRRRVRRSRQRRSRQRRGRRGRPRRRTGTPRCGHPKCRVPALEREPARLRPSDEGTRGWCGRRTSSASPPSSTARASCSRGSGRSTPSGS